MSTLFRIAFTLLLLILANNGWTALVITSGKSKLDTTNLTAVPGGVGGTGEVDVHVSVGARVNPPVAGFGAFTVTVPGTFFDSTFATLGRVRPKFRTIVPAPPPPSPPISPTSDSLTNRVSVPAPPPVFAHGATAAADWSSSLTINQNGISGTGSTHNASGVASGDFLFGPRAEAMARAFDPLEVQFGAPGSFTFSFFLGDSAIELDEQGNSLPELRIFSDDPVGTNTLHVSAGLSNATLMGRAINGNLFDLFIEAQGIIDSKDDLLITFLPGQALSLSDSMISAIEDHIVSSLGSLSDGSFGLPPGTSLPLIGVGSPLASLVMNHGTGTVQLFHVLDSVATSGVPEPPTLALISTVFGVLVIVFNLQTGPMSLSKRIPRKARSA